MSLPQSFPIASRLIQQVQAGMRGRTTLALDHVVARYERWGAQRLDRRWGIETVQPVAADRLDDGLVERLGGSGYDAVPPQRFDRIMATLRQHLLRTSDHTFVDIGAGKGRALLLAAQWSWRRIVGIELSDELVAQARRNLRTYHDHFAQGTPITLVHGNALDTPLPATPLVLFLNNPFGASVFDGFIDQLHLHHLATGCEVWVVYCDPAHEQVLQRASRTGWLRPVHCQSDWVLYRAAERPRHRLRSGA